MIAGRPNAGKSSLLNKPGWLRRGHRHAHARHHARRAARAHRDRRPAAARPRYGRAARVTRRRRSGGHPPCAPRDRTCRSRAVRSGFVRPRRDRRHRRRAGRTPAGGSAHPGLQQDRSQRRAAARRREGGRAARVYLCASSGAGSTDCALHLKDCIGFHPAAEGALSARTRHLDALRRARAHVEAAHRLLLERHAGELVAQELRDAHHDLGEITGEVSRATTCSGGSSPASASASSGARPAGANPTLQVSLRRTGTAPRTGTNRDSCPPARSARLRRCPRSADRTGVAGSWRG